MRKHFDRLVRFVRKVAAWHTHSWSTTHTNGFFMAAQQECLHCDAKRHRLLEFGKPESEDVWHPGPHPKSAGLE